MRLLLPPLTPSHPAPRCRPPHTPARTPRLPAPSAQEPPNRTRRACASRAWRAMETVDLKLVLLGAPRRAHPGPALPWRGAPAVRVAPRAPGSSGSLHTLHSATADPPSALRCAGQPGVGKTCLVYRYLYNTFGETISVRARLPPRLVPSQRARGAPLSRSRAVALSLSPPCHHLSPETPVTIDPCHHLPPPVTTCHQTIGASFAMKKVEANGRTCNLGIWDTAGQERFVRGSLSSFCLYGSTNYGSTYYGSTYYGSTHFGSTYHRSASTASRASIAAARAPPSSALTSPTAPPSRLSRPSG